MKQELIENLENYLENIYKKCDKIECNDCFFKARENIYNAACVLDELKKHLEHLEPKDNNTLKLKSDEKVMINNALYQYYLFVCEHVGQDVDYDPIQKIQEKVIEL